MTNKTAMLVTAYFGEEFPEIKQRMTKTLCSKLKDLGFFVCLSSHTPVCEDLQKYCDIFIYDKDNSFKINGIPENSTGNHGVSEFKSIYNGLNVLQRFNFDSIFKLAYDTNPNIDFIYVLEKCKKLNKKVVTSLWFQNQLTLGTTFFYTDIDFFYNSFPIEEVYRFTELFEGAWYKALIEKELLHEIYRFTTYEEFVEASPIEYCHGAGTLFNNSYPFDPMIK